jgi:phospholipid/cholesterol/gamma-HCH transport system substrate-binding protein
MSARLNPGRQLILGVFIVGTLSLLTYYTFFLKELSLFTEQEQITITFEQARGLRAGDSVLIAGVRWGRVAEVEYDSDASLDKRITVTATLTQPVDLREGGSFHIKDSTLLGGRVLSIDPGPPGAPILPTDRPYTGLIIASPLDAMGELLSKNGEAFTTALEGMAELVTNARDGQGVIGRLFTSEDLADKLSGTMEHIESITATIAAGEGTIGRLLASRDLYDSLTRSANDLEKTLANTLTISDDLEAGKGAMGALLKDEALATNLRDSLTKLNKIATRLEAGEGTIGKLLTDDTVYKNLDTITADFAVISTTLRSGEGSIGRLLMKDDLYKEIERALGLITRSLEEYREAAPITTMTSVLFSAF